MKHDHEDFERTTMPEQVPRAIKRDGGRTPTRLTPVTVRAHGVRIEAHHREYVRERLGHKLAKHAPAVERVYVRFDDLNGPKGGIDHACRIQVSLSGLGVVVVEERAADAISCFDLALDRAVHALDHRIGRVREGTQNARRRSEMRRSAAI
jgi:ribosome-associated translation inhibitor RaiA